MIAMKKCIYISFLFCCSFLFAQNKVAQRIQELEAKHTIFRPLKVVNPSKSIPDNTIEKTVGNASFATINKAVVNDIVANKYQNIELTFLYNGKNIVVQLYQVNLFSEGFHLDTDRNKNVPYQQGVYYRGIVKGDYTAVASFNFFNNELNGIISNSELSNLIIGKLNTKENTTDYIIYADANLKILNPFSCSFKDDDFTATQMPPLSDNKDSNSTRCVTMYFEIDYDLYQQNGSDSTATTNWMTSVFNNVQTLFNNDGITVSLRSVYIWTTQDPYEGIGTTSVAYLYKFNEVRPVFDGDVGQLVGIDSGGLGGVAVGVNKICKQDNFSYSDVDLYYETVPTYSWTIEVITHELGHLLGSPHTHACIWNGDNTPIDGCGQQAGYPNGTCAEGPIPSVTQKGTIMSYCHLIFGVGINFSNGFGPQPAARILSLVNNGVCLSTDCVNTCINTVASINTTSVTTSSANITWVDSGNSTAWRVRVYPFGGTPSSWTSVTTNSYSASGLLPNTYYIVDVSTSCTAGLEITGRQLIFVTAADFCNGIVFTDTGGSTNNYTNNETVIRTIVPDVPTNAIVLTFTEFALELDYDYLYVYDGNSTQAPLINTGGSTGTTIPGPFTSSAADGALTVKFFSDQGVVDTGFSAAISCTPNLSLANYNGYIDFTYSPNPSNGKVAITAKIPMSQVSVYSLTGQLLFENQPNENNTNVDISSFAVGTYFFKLTFEGNKEAHFKIVKM